MKRFFYLLAALLYCFNANAQITGETLFDNSYLHEVKIYFEEDDFWEILTDNYQAGYYSGDIEYLPTVQIIIDGNVMDTVGVRQKGFSSHFSSNEFKKSIKIDFNEFVSGQKYEGLRKLNLSNGVGDPSFQRDMLCYDMMRTAGIAAPRTAHTTVYLNDQYWGVYALIEQVDKSFLSDNFDDNDGDLFKNMGWSALEYFGNNPNDYKEVFDLKTNETEDNWTDFIELCDVINNSSNLQFPLQIQKVFNVDEYLRILAIDIMTNNWDSYIEHGRNWYLYHEPVSGLFHWVPWDYNLAMGGDFNTAGDPLVLDTICPLISDFSFTYVEDSLFLTDASIDATSWSWTFGDDSTSTEQNPMHVYDEIGIVNVCLTISNTFDDSLCTKTTCQNIDMNFSASDCNTIQNGSCPYPADDPVIIDVMMLNSFCCEVFWDGFCQDLYDDLSNGGGGPGGDPIINSFPLVLNNQERVLIDRLMDVADFRQLYLTHVCEIMEDNFTSERLYPLIDDAADLVRDAVYTDPYYMFSSNYFEWDVGFDGMPNGASIPQLKKFIDVRVPEIWNNLDNLNFLCDDWTTSAQWLDIAINEFVADNDSTSGIMDSEDEFEDWIELYNNSDAPIDLFGFYLTDNINNPKKWAFPSGVNIGPGEYLIVWADENQSQDGLHASFKLSKGGEQIMLSHQDGTVIDSLSYGPQETNIPSARIPNGTGDFINQAATFNTTNDEIIINTTDPDYFGFSLFPNPAKNMVRVTIQDEFIGQANARIRNALGQVVSAQEILAGRTHDFSIGHLAEGIYFMEIYDESNISTSKFIVQR